jgi:hypothetical protein
LVEPIKVPINEIAKLIGVCRIWIPFDI